MFHPLSLLKISKNYILRDLPALKHVWRSNSPYQDNATILQLQRLHIISCEMMEQVFLWNGENDTDPENHQIAIIFPNLIHLKLLNFTCLKAVCNGIESVKFPLMSLLEIAVCPLLKSLVSIQCSTADYNANNSEGIDHGDDGDECLHIFCNPEKVGFSRLKKLSVGGSENICSLWCHQIPIQDFFAGLKDLSLHDLNNIRSLFSSSIVTNLYNLRDLSIVRCEEMVKVIEDDNKETESRVYVFPNLQFLWIKELPKLEMFCGWKFCAIELPSLDTVRIYSCPEMKIFSLGPVTASYRVRFYVDSKEVINNTKDLNVVLQQPVFRGD